jgi:uroporphyrin-3 C-methyltransferase
MNDKVNGSSDDSAETTPIVAPTPAAAEAVSPQPSAPPPAPPAPAPAIGARGAGNGVAWLALLLAAGALGTTGFAIYRDDAQRQLDEYRLQSSLQEQVLALNQLQQQLSSLRSSARTTRQQLEQQLGELQSTLQQQQQRLGELARVDRSVWQLAEAEYLLQLAAQRLVLGGDPVSALRMLQQVDAILRELDDGALLPVRAALADDIAALKAMPVLDIEGTYLALDAAAKRAQQLQLLKPIAGTPASPSMPLDAQAGWSERLQHGLRAAVARLAELVQVRRHDEPYRALLAPEHEAALRHNLQLLFEQAQLALLAGNPALYDRALAKSRDWLLTYFALDEANARALAETIDELRQRPVTATPPDIGESRRLLKHYLEQRLRVAAPPPSANPESDGSNIDTVTEPRS